MAAVWVSVLLFLAVTLCLAVFTLFLCFVVYLHHSHKVYGHIPGPKREHFFWGNIKDLERKSKRSGTLDVVLEYCLEYGPVTLLWYFYKPVVIVSDPELVKKVLITGNLPKDPWLQGFVSFPFGERLLGGGLVTEVNHDVWQRKRTAMNPAFHRKYLKELITQFNSCCDEFLDRLSSLADGETEIKMADEFNRVTLDVIGKVAFGIDINSINDADSPFLAAIKEAIKAPIWIISNPFHALDITSYAYQNMVISAVQFLRDFGKKVIDERRRSVRDGDDLPPDILSHILKTAEQDPSISMEDLLDDFLTFFIAGQETTAGMLSFLLAELGRQPEIEERLVEEAEEALGSRQFVNYEDLGKLHYTGLAMKETLRLYPSVPILTRVMPEDEELGGHLIPAGTTIHVHPYTMHRHPKYWKDPEKFQPDRFGGEGSEEISHFTYLPFSSGPRSCIGQTFAQFEGKLLISRFLKSFKFKLVPGQNLNPEEPKATLSPKDGVRCTLTLR